MGGIVLPTMDDPIKIIHGDNVMAMRNMDSECADQFVTDCAYGVGAVQNSFNDRYRRRDFWAETNAWASEAYRVVKPGGWMTTTMGTRPDALARFVHGLGDARWKCDHSPLCWVRRGSFFRTTRLPDGGRMGFSPRQEFELIVSVSKGTGVSHVDQCAQDGCVPGTVAISQDPSDGWPFFDLKAFGQLETLPFIHCKHPAQRERDFGLETLPYREMPNSGLCMMADKRNFHPTPKPTKLMCYLLALFTEVGDLVVDPFFGSGTTGIACLIMRRRCIGIEQRADYCRIARLRVDAWRRRVARARKGFEEAS